MIINEKFANGVLYENAEVDEMLKIARKAPKDFMKYFGHSEFLSNNSDKKIIKQFVNSDYYYAEDFGRFDSAVGDEFVAMFCDFCRNEDFAKYISKDIDEEFVEHLNEFYG